MTIVLMYSNGKTERINQFNIDNVQQLIEL